MDKSSVITRNPDIVHDYLDERAVMMNTETGQYYQFNEVGTRIWELLENSSASIEDLADKITTEFNAGKEQAVADIITFVSKIAEQGLLRITK